jgi:hypothetical protein
MKPEIRAAVKTLAAAFKVIIDALAEEEAQKLPPPLPPVAQPTPTPAPPPAPTLAAGHEAHLVLSRFGPGLDFCCAAHEQAFEANVAAHGQAYRPMSHIGPRQREYIQHRLGRP